MSQKKPKLGQNFLTDPSARQRIVEALGDISSSTVLEIGPGRGALTDLLATRAKNLIAVELDRALAPRLTEKWKSASHVAILQADILELDLAARASDDTGTPGDRPWSWSETCRTTLRLTFCCICLRRQRPFRAQS